MPEIPTDHDPDSRRSTLNRVFSLGRVAGLAALLALASVSCRKAAEEVATEPVPQSNGVVLTPEQENAARQEAKARFKEALAKEPPFDRTSLTLSLLKETYKVDLNTLFPNGIDPALLKSKETIHAAVLAQVEHDANVKFPPEQKERLTKEADTKYPYYGIGTSVKLSLPGGRTLEGPVTEIGKDYVKVGLHKVQNADVLDPDVRLFNADTVKTMRESHVRINYQLDRDAWIKEEMAKRMPQALKDGGFVRAEGLPQLVRIDALIDEKITPLVDHEEKKYREAVTERLTAQINQEMVREKKIPGFFIPTDKPAPKPADAAAPTAETTDTAGEPPAAETTEAPAEAETPAAPAKADTKAGDEGWED